MPTLEQTIADMAAELRQIAESNWKGYDAWTEDENGILDGPRVRQLGEQANRIGGFMAMSDVCEAITPLIADRRLLMAMRTELNMRWNGIGDWMC